jgi:polyribonucleotide nucleotidyltransferase
MTIAALAKIGLLIGPGGKTIRAIQDSTGASIEVEDDGTVTVASHDAEGAMAAMAQVEALTASIQIGRISSGLRPSVLVPFSMMSARTVSISLVSVMRLTS